MTTTIDIHYAAAVHDQLEAQTGERWDAASPQGVGWRLTCPATGEILFLRDGDYGTGRVALRGDWPDGARKHVYDLPSLGRSTVRADRPASALVRQWVRQHRPTYLRNLAVVTERLAQHREHEAATGAVMARLTAIHPGVSRQNMSPDRARLYLPGDVYGDLWVNGTSVAIELRALTPDQAERILRIATFEGE